MKLNWIVPYFHKKSDKPIFIVIVFVIIQIIWNSVTPKPVRDVVIIKGVPATVIIIIFVVIFLSLVMDVILGPAATWEENAMGALDVAFCKVAR